MKTVPAALFAFLLLAPVLAEEKTVYTGASEGNLVIAAEDVWYLEECDVLSRPVSGTLWKKGAIEERTSWLYEADSRTAAAKIVTGPEGTTETRYDADLNITGIEVSDLAGAAVSTLTNSYTAENLLAESLSTEGSRTTAIRYEYGADKKLLQKKRYENGELAVVYRYESDDNWTETVYSKSVPVLTVTYENGARKKDGDEKKQ